MATIVPNLTTINSCESTTGFTANAAALDTDLKKEGTYSIGSTIKSNTTEMYYTFSALNLTGQTIRFWFNTINFPYMNTKALGGMRVRVTSSAGIAYWNIHGKDTYNGGWVNVVIDMGSTPTTGTLNAASVTAIGISQNLPGSPKNVTNTWMDYIRYGNGLTVYGTPEFSIEEVYQADLAAGYGIVDKIDGVYYLLGSLVIGDAAGTNATIYKDEDKVLVFSDAIVASTLYKIQTVGNATGDTDVTFKGCVITSAGPLFDLDFDSADVESVLITGCSISETDETLLNAICEVLNSSFNACGLITVGEAIFTDITVSNAASNALQYPATEALNNTARITFIDCVYGILITVDQDFVFDGHKFSGTFTAHINNTSGQLIVISATNGANPSTYTGSVTISNAVTLTLTGIITGSEIRILKTGTSTNADSTDSSAYEDSLVGTEHSFTYSSPPVGYTAVDIFIVQPGYEWYAVFAYPLGTLSASLPIKQDIDRNYVV